MEIDRLPARALYCHVTGERSQGSKKVDRKHQGRFRTTEYTIQRRRSQLQRQNCMETANIIDLSVIVMTDEKKRRRILTNSNNIKALYGVCRRAAVVFMLTDNIYYGLSFYSVRVLTAIIGFLMLLYWPTILGVGCPPKRCLDKTRTVPSTPQSSKKLDSPSPR